MNEELIDLINVEFDIDTHDTSYYWTTFKKFKHYMFEVYIEEEFISRIGFMVFNPLAGGSYTINKHLTVQEIISIIKLLLSIYDK
jgi:hypothetical protein